MSGRELDQHTLILREMKGSEVRAAAVHAADHLAAQHPHPLDDVMPKLAGRQLAADPVIAAGLLELLDALGFRRAAS